MTRMVQVAIAGDVAEGEEIQSILTTAGIESELAAAGEDDPLTVVVPESSLEAAQDAIEALTEPDGLIPSRRLHYSRTNSSRVEPTSPGLTSSKMHGSRPSASGGAGTLPVQTVLGATRGRAAVRPFTRISIGVPCLPNSVSSSRPGPQA